MSHINDMADIWEMVKSSFHSRLPQTAIDLWFGELKIVSYEDNIITFSTESEFKYKIITEKYLEMIAKGFSSILGFDIEAKIRFDGVPVDAEKIKQQFMGSIQREKAEKEAKEKSKNNGSNNPRRR